MPPLRPLATVSAERRAELQKAFATFDKDGSGAISVDELAAILGMGKKISPEQARKDAEGVIAKYDMDGNNELDVRGRAPIQRMQLPSTSHFHARIDAYVVEPAALLLLRTSVHLLFDPLLTKRRFVSARVHRLRSSLLGQRVHRPE